MGVSAFSDPPLNDWRLVSPPAADRAPLASVVAQRAARLGTASLAQREPLIATGHQPWLWHPGILAKDLALAEAAARFNAASLHAVVDQDVHASLTLELPRQQGPALHLDRLQLAPQQHAVPAGFHPPVEAAMIRDRLHQQSRPDLLQPLIDAFTDLPDCRTLAEQITVALNRLKRPLIGDQPIVMVSDFAALPAFESLIEAMRTDARRCALAYNRAVNAYPGSGVAPLAITREWIELPLWVCTWRQPRQRVLVDVAADPARLVTPDGEPVNTNRQSVLPRALTLTAMMRSRLCDFFIHGTGGGAYDRVTDAWWHGWRNQPLAETAVVSADAQLDFDVPLADRADLAAARWQAHHAPHNVDRLLHLEGPLVREKWRLIHAMGSDRDPWRGWLGFCAIHRLNAELVHREPHVVEQANRRLAEAAQGLANQRIATKRDWCFALYDRTILQQLAEQLSPSAAPTSTPARTQNGRNFR